MLGSIHTPVGFVMLILQFKLCVEWCALFGVFVGM